MPKLKYAPESFGQYWGRRLTQPSYINFTWEELCKSAITVGRSSWKDVLLHGNFSAFEILWRFAMLRANLVEDKTGYLQPSKAFKALDPSEKGAVSFFLGMCFTKLIIEKLFGVSWLLHIDVYRSMLNPWLAFKSRPDFVGLDARQQWIVVESKGRSWSLPNKTMEKAKLQTRSLRNINGELPILKVAIGSYFSSNGINAKIWDPEEYDDNAEDIEIDSNQFARAYYRPLVEYIKLQSSFSPLDVYSQKDKQQTVLNVLDARVALDDEILAWYDKDNNFWDSIVAPKVGKRDSILTEVSALKRDMRQEGESVRTSLPQPREGTDAPMKPRHDLDRQARGDKVSEDKERIKLNLKRQEKIKELIENQRTSDIGTAIDGVKVELGDSWSSNHMRRQPQNRLS
jgi:hypothetical protein